jgi:hypothetical protein
MPPLEPIAALNVQPRDYKKDHRNDDKYNVKHFSAPEVLAFDTSHSAKGMPTL